MKLLILGLAFSLYWASLLWLTYIALEPYMRQLYPESLNTWTRLLAGQTRDPRLGRDLLLGALAGTLIQVIDLMGRTLPAELGATVPAPDFDWWIPNTHIRGYLIGNLLDNLVYSIRMAFFYKLLLYLVLRSLIRWQLPAACVYVLVSTALWVGTTATLELSWSWLFGALIELLLLWLLLRVGVVAVIVATYVWYCLCFPLTTDLAAWHSQSTLFALGPVVLLAGFGYYNSLAGKAGRWQFRNDLATLEQ